MMKEYFKKVCGLMFLILIGLSQGCVHDIAGYKMALKSKMNNPVILNLRNYRQSSIDLLRQSENLVRGHLVQQGGQEYGYFYVDYDYSNAYVEDQAMLMVLIHSLFGFALIPLGFPTASEDFSLYAYLYVFDSQGNLVKEYKEYDSFTHVAGLYYGYHPTRRAARRFSKMYDNIFELATLHSQEINDALRKAGPITEENKESGREAIDNYFKEKEKKKNRSTSSSITTVSSEPSFEDSSSFSTSEVNGGLEAGKYYCVQYPNFKMSISMGLVTISEDYKTVAMGNASISGRDMIINFYFGIDSWEALKGQSVSYIIDDSKHFHAAVGSENWTYQGLF